MLTLIASTFVESMVHSHGPYMGGLTVAPQSVMRSALLAVHSVFEAQLLSNSSLKLMCGLKLSVYNDALAVSVKCHAVCGLTGHLAEALKWCHMGAMTCVFVCDLVKVERTHQVHWRVHEIRPF